MLGHPTLLGRVALSDRRKCLQNAFNLVSLVQVRKVKQLVVPSQLVWGRELTLAQLTCPFQIASGADQVGKASEY